MMPVGAGGLQETRDGELDMRVPVAIGAACGLSLGLAACAVIPPVAPSSPPPVSASLLAPENALLAGIRPGPGIGALGLSPGNAATALASFRESCPRLTAREDASGLARAADWQVACSAAAAWPESRARDFFAAHFETARIGAGEAFATGYYEPEILGSRTRRPGFAAPVYAMPSDLVREWPDSVAPAEREGRPPLGRRDASGAFVPYFSRAEIEDGALDGRVPVIAWAADPVELFFLQIQGSGRLVTPEGEVIRIGYAGQNGRAYTSIGAVMRERGLLGEGPGQYPGSMQGIMAYLRENPEEGRALMRENESWIFFRELTGDGPIGALGVPVRPRASVAADPRFVPLGAPVWLDLDRDEADGLWIAQDTGGAIKGANRFDTFWGAGPQARATAGTMSGRGEALVLLPKGTFDRRARQR
jgi:membrane-bound lytic murein transglycosylase A